MDPPVKQFDTHLQGNYSLTLFMHPTDTTAIIRTIQKIKTKCKEGFDGLSTKILQAAIHEIASPHIKNKSFVTGIVSVNLKVAKIIPVF